LPHSQLHPLPLLPPLHLLPQPPLLQP